MLATHLTEMVRENMADLLSYAETQKLLDELPAEQQKLVADLIPAQIGVGGMQRVLQALLAERVSIRDLPTILEGIQEACAAAARVGAAIVAHRARQAGAADQRRGTRAAGLHADDHAVGRNGRWRSPRRWSVRRRNASSPWRRRGCRNSCSALRAAFDAATAAGEQPALICSAPIRPHVRAIVERFRPATMVLAHAEIHPRARIRTVGTL